MGIIAWIVFGVIAGWAASAIMKSNDSLLTNIILGIVGAFVGGLIMSFLGGEGVSGFNIYSFLVAILGAVVVIWIGRAFRKPVA